MKAIKLIIFASALITGLTAQAQMKGDHMLGDYGLAAGTQAPPSLIAMVVPAYNYHTSKYINNDGDKIGIPNINMYVLGAGASVVTNFKILGANYGASLLLAFTNSKIEGNIGGNNIYSKTSLAFSDTYIQPVQLGWHWNRADMTAGYALYMPTGKYEFGGDSNSGLGLWTNEFSAGTTLYLDNSKSWNFSTIAFYEIHSKKKGTDMKPGDLMTFEGGLAKAFHAPVEINVGPVYYAQFKMTNDNIPIGNQMFSGTKDHIYALGLEANVLIPKTFTSLSVRWLGELGAKNRTEGNTFMITIGQFLSSFEKKK